MSDRPYTAVVLAGQRLRAEPVAMAAGVQHKVLAPVGDVPMLQRVLTALEGSRTVADAVVCGERAALERSVSTPPGTRWVSPGASPTSSALGAFSLIPEGRPVLLTTGDHCLLSAAIVDHFCAQAAARGTDVVVGLVPYPLVRARFPGQRRTVLRLGNGGYCGSNLFAFLTPAGRRAVEYWRRLESLRKQPLRMALRLGAMTCISYLLGRLDLPAAMNRLSALTQARVSATELPFPEAAFDVDTAADWHAANAAVATQQGLAGDSEGRAKG